MHLDKSLPSLPASMVAPENNPPPPSSSDIYSDSTTEHLPQSRQEDDRAAKSYSSHQGMFEVTRGESFDVGFG